MAAISLEAMRKWRQAQSALSLARIGHANGIMGDEELDGYVFRCEQARREVEQQKRAAA